MAGGAGALVGLRYAPPTTPLAVALSALAFTIVMRPRAITPRVLSASFLLLGLCAGAQAARGAREDCRARIPDGAAVRAVGVLRALPWEDGTVPLAAERLESEGLRCSGELRVRLPRRAKLPEPGERIELQGRWWSIPAESPWPRPPERAGTFVSSRLEALDGTDPITALRVRTQARLRALLPERSNFAEALLLERKEGLGPDVRLRFAESGLAHLLAISGTHVTLLAGTIVLLAGVLRLAPRPAAGIAAGVVVAYVLFLGAPWAAARAMIQVLLLLAARLLQRPADSIGLLAAAGVAIAAYDPLALLDAGFQLSFAGIFGLIAWRDPVSRALPAMPKALRDALAAGTAATFTTGPIAALHFGQLSIIGIVANLPAIPIVAFAVPALGLVLLVDRVASSTAAFLAGAPDLLLCGLDAVARIAADAPGGHFAVTTTGVLFLLAAAGAAVLAAGRVRSSQRWLALPAGAAVLVASAPLTRAFGSGDLEIHAIDVGQGDAIAIRTPRGRWILVDAGPRTDRFDAGRRRVAPYLLRHGTRRVEALVVTHPDADHIGGVPAVFDVLDVGMVIEPSRPTLKDIYLESLEAARREPARWYAARAGRSISFDGVTLAFLYPDSAALDGPGGANDLSAVFRLDYGTFQGLFLGDAPEAVEDALVERHGPELEVELLKVGHHGSRTSTGATLLAATRPQWAIVPVGRGNRYGHPHPTVIARLARHGVRVLRTDLEGSFRLRVRADGSVTVSRTR